MTQKARVATIEYAGLTFEGLMLPNGSFGMTLSQVIALFYENTKMSVKGLKQRTGLPFKSIQKRVKTELSKNPSTVIGLEDVVLLIQVMAEKGNQKAIAFAVASMAEKLERIFAKTFDQKFDEEQAEIRFQERLTHRKGYHPKFTSWLKKDGYFTGWQYGQQMNLFKSIIGLPQAPIDQYNYHQLQQLNIAENQYDILRRSGLNHEQSTQLISEQNEA